MIEMFSSIGGDPFGHPTPPCEDDRQPIQGAVSIMEGASRGADSSYLSDIDDPTGHPHPLDLRDRRVDKFSPHMRKKLCRWGIFAVVLVVVGIVALLVSNNATNKQKVDPLFAYKERFNNFRTILGNYSQPWTFALPNSPQTKSLQWLVFQDQTLSTNPDVKRLVQRHALMTLFYGCDGENWAGTLAVSPPWIQEVGTHECEFAGVTCDEAGTIVQFEAGQGQLSGQLPDEISLLSHLISLKIYVSNLQGTLPVSLFTRLSNLELLSFAENSIASTIPSEIGLTSNLRELHLTNNLLTGTIPETLSALDLRVLSVQNNDLTGQVLGYLDSWPNMGYLNVEKTLITGTIPESIGTLKGLERLYLGQHLNGTLPASFADLTNMVEFRISGNNLSGSIPSNFGQLSRLERFMFDETGLEGPIPTSLGKLSALSELVIGGSDMTGTIPTELGMLSRLTRLVLAEMPYLSGTVPTEIGSLPLLEYFQVQETDVAGSVPTSFCREGLEFTRSCRVECSCCTIPCYEN